MNRVDAGYFEAMGLSILQGRPIQLADEQERDSWSHSCTGSPQRTRRSIWAWRERCWR